MEVLPETKLFRMRCSIIWCKDYVYVWKYERFLQVTFMYNWNIVFLKASLLL